MFDIHKEVLCADAQIRPYIRETPLDFSVPFSKITKANVYFKYETIQYTHSFKVRGALNKLLSLTAKEKQQGVVTASTGNHGAGVAYGLKKLNIPGIIFVPENAAATKIDNIHNYDARVEFFGTDCMQTEVHALEYAKQNQMTYVAPYNDEKVIAGQGTIGLELARQLQSIDAVLVPIGGGGLIAGIAGFLKVVSPQTQIIGCLPENSPVMAESVKAGKIINMETLPTLSDATAGGLEPGAITFELCQALVDDYLLVSEDEIKNAMLQFIQKEHQLIEGAPAVALAALLKNAARFKDKNVVVILSGGNISIETLLRVLQG